MERHIKPIGGEYWYDFSIFQNKIDNFKEIEGTFLDGGISSIKFILNKISPRKNEYVLLPSYLCPTILYPFKEMGISYKLYRINKDLSIDKEDIEKKINEISVKALYFIDYFGVYHNNDNLNFLQNLKKKGIILVEDAVQMLWVNKQRFVGDYIFNSYRKFFPIDGSIVLGPKTEKYNEQHNNYHEYIHKARYYKHLFINLSIKCEEEYLRLFKIAKKEYYKRDQVSGINKISKQLLSKVDIENIRQKIKDNYEYIYMQLDNAPKIDFIYSREQIMDNIPLGVPILIDNRDRIRLKLMNYSIYCPVHWRLEGEEWLSDEFVVSKKISNRILTLPIDYRYNFKDLERLVGTLKKII